MSRKKEINSALWKRLQPLLPIVKPSPHGGRSRLDDELALDGILFVLRTGIAWEDLLQELGFGSGMTCCHRLREWQAAGVLHQLHQMLLAELRGAGRLDFSRASIGGASVPGPPGGSHTGPNPTDRGKLGSKRHVVTDLAGISLVFCVTGATGTTRSSSKNSSTTCLLSEA